MAEVKSPLQLHCIAFLKCTIPDLFGLEHEPSAYGNLCAIDKLTKVGKKKRKDGRMEKQEY